MFTWGSSSKASTSTTSTYPAQRPHVIQGRVVNSSGNALQTGTGYTRRQHLDSYLQDPILSRSTRRASNDDTTYDTVFSTQTGRALILRVHISSGEGVTPAMSLIGVRASHPWLDSRNMRVIGYPAILNDTNWQLSGIKLGKAVTDVVQHLQIHPPEILQVTDPVIEKLQRQQDAKQQQHSRNNSRATPPPPPPEEVFQVDMPPIPSFFSEINSMSKAEVRELLDDEQRFKLFMSKQYAVTRIDDQQSPLLEKNIRKAEENCSKESPLDAAHSETVVMQAELKEKISAFEALQKVYNDVCAPADTQVVVQKLHAAKREAFNETEKLANKWLDSGNMDADSFTRQFMSERIVFHKRAAKLERLMTQPQPHR